MYLFIKVDAPKTKLFSVNQKKKNVYSYRVVNFKIANHFLLLEKWQKNRTDSSRNPDNFLYYLLHSQSLENILSATYFDKRFRRHFFIWDPKFCCLFSWNLNQILHFVTLLLLFSETCCNLLFPVCFWKQYSSTHWLASCLVYFIEVTITEVRYCSYLTTQISAHVSLAQGFLLSLLHSKAVISM